MEVLISLVDLIIQVQSIVFRSDPEFSEAVFADLYNVITADAIPLSGFSVARKTTGG